MPVVRGFLNVYRSGHFHRAGKPGAFDRHGGDLYPDEESARAEITPASHYVTTVPVAWWEDEWPAPEPNPAQSKPVPLSKTRGRSPPRKIQKTPA